MALRRANKPHGGWERVRNTVLASGILHSPLWHWMRRNHRGLSKLFKQAPPAWAVLAKTFDGMGLTDREGKSPTADTTRKTWYRVRRDVAAAHARRAGPATVSPVPGIALLPPSVVSPPPRPSPMPIPPSPGPVSGDPEPAPPRFGLAHPRGHRPSAASAPPPVPDRIRRSPEEVERIVADLMRNAPRNRFRREEGD